MMLKKFCMYYLKTTVLSQIDWDLKIKIISSFVNCSIENKEMFLFMLQIEEHPSPEDAGLHFGRPAALWRSQG